MWVFQLLEEDNYWGPFTDRRYLAIIEWGWILQISEGDNNLRDLQNSSYPTTAEFNNCFIIPSK